MNRNNGLKGALEQFSTVELDNMLQTELQEKRPDAAAIRMIMDILRERDTEEPFEVNSEIEREWEKYNRSGNTHRAIEIMPRCCGSLLRVVAIALIVGMLFFALPQKVTAKGLWDRLIHITDSIFEFFNPSDANDHRVEYQFQTDNPGLQQLYDAVVKLGITEPVVPMWLPEEYKLIEIKSSNTISTKKCYARFSTLATEMVFQIEIYRTTQRHTYYKDATDYTEKEICGITHNILRNNDLWVVVWTIDSVECFLTIDCQEDILYDILKSIYVMEDK